MQIENRNKQHSAARVSVVACVVAAATGIIFFHLIPMSLDGMLSAEPFHMAAALQQVPKNWVAILPDKMPWTKNPDGSARDIAKVVGDPSKPGLYILLVRWPPHTVAKAHSHPDDRYVAVLSGTFYSGHGEKSDPSKLEVRPTGTFFTEPARIAHFGETKDKGAILYFVGTGPSSTDPIEK